MPEYSPAPLTATIAISAQLSDEVDISAFRFMALKMPAAFTGTAITFEATDTEGGTTVEVLDDAGSPLSITVSANKVVTLSAGMQAQLAALRFIKLKSGSAEAAARSIAVIVGQ